MQLEGKQIGDSLCIGDVTTVAGEEWVEISVTTDSGAADTVAPPGIATWVKLRKNKASKAATSLEIRHEFHSSGVEQSETSGTRRSNTNHLQKE